MYIIKNALRCISRSKGRNVLIGIIALVIAVSACIGLSIRQAAQSAKENALDGMSVTATISIDRQSMINGMGADKGGGFDREQFAGMMGATSSLTLDEYLIYANASSVQNFYYTLTAYFNGSEGLTAVTEDESDGTLNGNLSGGGSNFPGLPNGMGGGMGGRTQSGDFTVIGYSSYSAMTDFIDGLTSISENGGTVFDEGTTERTCVISTELATVNGISVGDTVTVTNTKNDAESYDLTVVGIYTSTKTNDFSISKFGASQDPANQIYMSAAALQLIIDESKSVSTTVTDEYGRETETATVGNLNGTYVFEDTDAYYVFENEVRTMGLDEKYTVVSNDINAFENSIGPLNTLSTMAGWFLIVILIIGGIILVVLNIFNVRERKYEVGVLTAMGMKKWKVALQFMCEILVVTMVAVVIGAGIGAVSSVPVTNALLEDQIEDQNSQQEQINNNFGKPGGMPGGFGGNVSGFTPPDMPNNAEGGKDGFFKDMFNGATDYVSEVNSAMNLTVVIQMIGVGLLLTLKASAASVLFIMRYDPLKILANRD